LTLEGGLKIGTLVQLVALDERGDLASRLGGDFFLQQTARAQNQGWRVNVLRLCQRVAAQHAHHQPRQGANLAVKMGQQHEKGKTFEKAGPETRSPKNRAAWGRL
jgi:hypothetical protein